MSRNIHLHLLWLGVATMAFLAGIWMSSPDRDAATEPPVRNSSVRENAGRLHPIRATQTNSSRVGGRQSDVRELAQRAFWSNDPVDSAIAFAGLLGELTPQNAETIESEFIGRKAKGVADAQRRLLRYAWGTIDGRGAAQYAVDNLRGELLGLFLQEMLPGWGCGDPASGIAWIDGPGPAVVDESIRSSGADFDRFGGMLENYRINFICGIADRDIQRATDYAYQTTNQADLGEILQSVASKALRQLGVTGAVVWVQELPEGPPKGVAMESVASAYADSDPQAAAEWAERYADKDWAQGALTIIRSRLYQTPAFGQ